MCVDVADSDAKQLIVIDESHHLVLRGNRGLRKVAKQVQHLVAVGELAQGKFPNHPRVA